MKINKKQMKKFLLWFIIFTILLNVYVNFDGLFPYYHPFWKMNIYTRQIVDDTTFYIMKRKYYINSGYDPMIVYLFMDSEGCLFTVSDIPDSTYLWYWGSSPENTYQPMKIKKHAKEINTVLKDAGLTWTNYSSSFEPYYDKNPFEFAQNSVSSSTAHFIRIEIYEEADLEKIAEVGAKIDEILSLHYHEYIEHTIIGKHYTNDYEKSGMRFVFIDKETKEYISAVQFDFSTSNKTRWTKESLLSKFQKDFKKNKHVYKEKRLKP